MDIFRDLFEELAPEDNIEKIKKEVKNFYTKSKWFSTPIPELLKEINI